MFMVYWPGFLGRAFRTRSVKKAFVYLHVHGEYVDGNLSLQRLFRSLLFHPLPPLASGYSDQG